VCLLDPLSGNFDQDQCDHLARSAARIVGYFEARQQVLDEQPDVSRTSAHRIDPRAERSSHDVSSSTAIFEVAPRYVTPTAETFADDAERRVKSKQAKAPKKPKNKDKNKDTAQGKDKFRGQDKSQGKNKDQGKKSNKRAPGKNKNRSITEILKMDVESDARRADLRLNVDEFITARAPSELGQPDRVIDDRSGHDGYLGLRSSDAHENTPIQGLLVALELDPITGLGGLPALFGELGIALSAPRSENGCVVLTLLCFVPTRPVKAKLVNQVAVELGQTLRNHVRGDDAVFRIAESVFAVVTTLRSHAVFPENIQDRLNQALRFAIASRQAPFEIRSSLVTTSDHEGGIGPELFFRGAMLDLDL